MKWTFVLPLILALTLSACATKKKTVAPPSPGSTQDPLTTGPQPTGDQFGKPSPGSREDFRVSAGDRVFFGYDQYTLSPEAREALRRQAAWLKAYPAARIKIAGHCDERGTREYNLALGARRAQSAYDYLVSLGISPSRMTTISYGKELPFDPGSSEQARAVNRNAHTQITSMPRS